MVIVVFAYSQLGFDCLRVLIQRNVPVDAVWTHLPKPGEWIGSDRVDALAQSFQIPVFYDHPNQSIHWFTQKPIRLILSFYYRFMISPVILHLSSRGAFNIHGSLLPNYRGRCPVNWAILHGETQTGATLHQMVEKPDAGKIIDQKPVSIEWGDQAGDVQKKVNQAATIILSRQLDNLLNGEITGFSQELSKGSYFGGRSPKDGLIHWDQSASQVYNLIRSLQPNPQYPPAWTIWNEKIYAITKASWPPVFSQELPGYHQPDSDWWVTCGNHQALNLQAHTIELSLI